MKRSQRRKGEGGWWMWGGAALPLRSKSTTLILTQHGILIAFTRSSRAARSPDDGWCELTGRWTSWAEGKLGAARYRASTPSSLVTVCVFPCLLDVCAPAWVSTDVRGRERGERGRWRPTRRKGSAKMMFDMRGEARSRGTCSVRQQVARRISQSPQTSISTLDCASSSRYF